MLPSLSGLDSRVLHCQPVGVILEKWEDRLNPEMLKDEKKEPLPGSIPTSYNDSRTECAICLQELRHDNNGNEDGDKRVLTLVDFKGACGHSFHVTCLSTWLDNRNSFDQTLQCPVCKKPILDKWVDATYNRIRGKRPAATTEPSRVPYRMTLRELENWRRANPNPVRGWRNLLMDVYEELVGRDLRVSVTRWLQIIRTLSEQARVQLDDPRRTTNLW